MSTLVFSDTHFSKKFDVKRFSKLVELIKNADQVVINGDFWEGQAITFDEFLQSKWKELFPLLKAKKTVYVYGNHDHSVISDDRVYEFCDKAVKDYTLNRPSKTYHFTHGDSFLYPHHDKEDIESHSKPDWHTKTDNFIGSKIQAILFKIAGPNIFPKSFNNMTLEIRKSIAPIEHLLVCGHSHKPQYIPEMNFIDIGFFNYGWANYMLINDDTGDFKFVSEKY